MTRTKSISTIHEAIEFGVKLFDSADVYGDGHNESLLGRGFLTGPMDSAPVIEGSDYRLQPPRFATGSMRANHRIVDLVHDVAAAEVPTVNTFRPFLESPSRGH